MLYSFQQNQPPKEFFGQINIKEIQMKSRLFVAVVVALVAFSLTVAGEKGSKKSTSEKKEMKGCCSEMKSAKAECSDKDMKHCDTKDAKMTTKAADAKAEVKVSKESEKK
jgi:hypothetical protein